MTDQQHPITPPPELVKQWLENSPEDDELRIAGYIATRAAQWGADQELEACINWISVWHGLEHPELLIELLRTARRPKSATLKKQSLKHLEVMERDGHYLPEILQDLRRAVEQLDD